MTAEERDDLLDKLKVFSKSAYDYDIDAVIDAVIDGFILVDASCTHELIYLDERGFLKCKCGKHMRWPENTINAIQANKTL